MILITTVFVYVIYLSSNCINADANLRTAFSPFGNLANQFLSSVQPNDELTVLRSVLLNATGGDGFSTKVTFEDLKPYWKIYVVYLILAVIGLLFIIIFTITGLCLCCCRCCCKRCGAKPSDSLDKKKKTKKIIFQVFLFLLTTMIFIGAIVSMASNVILADAIKSPADTTDPTGNFLSSIDISINQTTSFVSYIIRNLLTNGITVLNNATESLMNLLYNCVELFIKTFFDKVNINAIVNSSDAVIKGYQGLSNASSNLSVIATSHKNKSPLFSQYLQSVQNNLTNILNSTACQNYTSYCNQIRSMLPTLTIGYDVTKINYTMDIYMGSFVNTFNISELVNAKNTMLNNIANISATINSTIYGQLKNTTNSINISSTIYSTFTYNYNATEIVAHNLNYVRNSIFKANISGVTVENGAIYNYYRYFFYALCILIALILLVVLFFYVGLIFGIFGQTNFEKESHCNTSVGCRFLMGGVVISFLFGWLLMLIVTIMFLTGGLFQTEACRYVSGTNTKSLAIVDGVVNTIITKGNFTFPVNDILITIPNIDLLQSVFIRCPASTDLLSAFRIPTTYLSSLADNVYQQMVAPRLGGVVNQLRNYIIPAIDTEPIRNSTETFLTLLNNIMSVNSSETLAELNKPVTNVIDIYSFVQMIRNLSLMSAQSNPEFSTDLNSTIAGLAETVTDMNLIQNSYLQQKRNFTPTIRNLDSDLRTLSLMIGNISSNIINAKNTAISVANSSIWQNSSSLLNQTLFNVVNVLGNCQGLSTAVKSAVGIVCTNLLVPFNNIWMGIGWFLLFIIPAIIFALKLHQLYRISHVNNDSAQLNKAYQGSTHILSQRDMELIRMVRPQKI